MDDDDKPRSGEVVELFRRPDKRPPVRYSETLATEIAIAYATTAYGLRTLCKMHPEWPHRVTLFEWRLKYPDFDRAMDMARMERAGDFMDESVEIADDASRDTLNGEPNPVAVGRSKLQVEARQKWALMMCPERYGNRAEGYHSPDYLPQDEAIKYLK